MSDITIHGLTHTQCAIADLIWSSSSQAEAMEIVRACGPDGQIVWSMMTAALLDDVTVVSEATAVLDQFRL